MQSSPQFAGFSQPFVSFEISLSPSAPGPRVARLTRFFSKMDVDQTLQHVTMACDTLNMRGQYTVQTNNNTVTCFFLFTTECVCVRERERERERERRRRVKTNAFHVVKKKRRSRATRKGTVGCRAWLPVRLKLWEVFFFFFGHDCPLILDHHTSASAFFLFLPFAPSSFFFLFVLIQVIVDTLDSRGVSLKFTVRVFFLAPELILVDFRRAKV